MTSSCALPWAPLFPFLFNKEKESLVSVSELSLAVAGKELICLERSVMPPGRFSLDSRSSVS